MQQVRLNLRLSNKAAVAFRDIIDGLPKLEGGPICIRDRAPLKAHRGKLVSHNTPHGTPVHAAAFIRRREIVLESDLLAQPTLLRLTVVHEVFHFVWVRLPNHLRAAFSEILMREQQAQARGELGESSSTRKLLLRPADCRTNSRAWREYVCESFCDTAAWVFAGVRRDPAFTLSKRWKGIRASWFEQTLERGARF